ncbi:hypothetical protein CF326_g4608 [Tilletia indica]|nr:hypothetical protein CF326_g4608 [Tilletia indica]
MHASSSRLITIRIIKKDLVKPNELRLPPGLKRGGPAPKSATTSTPIPGHAKRPSHELVSKVEKRLVTDTASKLLLRREREIQMTAATQLTANAAGPEVDGGAASADTSAATAAAALASSWPSNLRIEPEVNKRDLYWKVPTEKREQLKKMLKATR